MRRLLALLVALLLVAMLGSLCSCACDDDDDDDDQPGDDDDDDDDEDIQDLIDQGKHWLEIGEGDKARLVFLEALDVVPGHPEATYGLALADGLHEMDVIGIIYDYLMSFIDGSGPVKGEDTQGLLDQLLHDVLDGLVIERADELVSAAQTAQQAQATFEVEIPMIIGFEELGYAGSEWDQADLLALESFGDLLSGLLKHIFVIDLNTNLGYIFIFIEMDTSGETIDIVGLVVDVLIQMLTDPAYPDFLTLDAEGIELYREAGLQFGLGLDRFLRTFEAITLETDDQSDDVLGYYDLNGSGVWDAADPWTIPYYGALDERQMAWWAVISGIVGAMRDTYLDYTIYDVDPANPNPLHFSVFNPLLQMFNLPPLFNEEMTLDIGQWYLNPNPTSIRDGLLQILQLVDALLP
ncbi:MAG: hypothetical protein P9M14_09945 [Candidatus Alcyoniella australis]|nr:hypothetical protein [Candidatus Alcyoniella australis]